MSIQSRSASPPGVAAAAIVVLVGTLISIYIVSQFLRNSVGVIAPDLAAELGLSPAELGTSVERILPRVRGRSDPA